MFRNSLSLLLIILLIGFMAGCGSSNPFADDAQSSIEEQNYQAALDAAEQAISEYPADPLGYYYKAVALGNLADEQPAGQRQSYYERMNETFQKAREVASQLEDPSDAPDELSRIDVVKDAIWRTEHNQGIAYATDDSLMGTVENPYERAAEHLRNATYVWPDSMLSYDVLSQIYALQANFEQAAEVKGKVLNSESWEPDTSDYAQYGNYLMRAGQTEKAVEVLEKAQERYPDGVQIRQLLADLYMRTGRQEQAISMVRDLVEQDPDNPRYRLALGTQIYQAALTYSDSLDANVERIYDIQQQARDQEITADEADSMITRLRDQNAELRDIFIKRGQEAVTHLEQVLEAQPKNERALNSMAIIYQNWGLTVFDQRNLTRDNEKAKKLAEEARGYLEESMKYYERATEISPDNTEYWNALFQIYTTLGMDEKAQEAAEKAGIQGN